MGCFSKSCCKDEREMAQVDVGETVLRLPVRFRKSSWTLSWRRWIRRMLLLETKQSHDSNYIQTTKYTRYNFPFKCFMEQFYNISNLYFLFIVILSYVGFTTPLFSTPYNGTGILTALALVIAINMTGEGYYDLKRNAEDKKINSKRAYRLRPGDGHIETIHWSEVSPGDVLKVYDRQQFPADLIFLSSGLRTNKCYVETSNIDGETNLKIKYIPKELSELCSFPEVAASLEATCTYEEPNAFLSFSGSIKISGPRTGFAILGYENEISAPLDFSNLLLRGSMLRNTPWVLGLVAYAGYETKVVKSSSKTPSKVSNIQRLVNKVMIIMLVVQLILCTVSSIIEIFSFPPDDYFWYLRSDGRDVVFPPYIANICTFIVLYSSLIPIALLVIMTLVKLGHAMLINWDLNMYHEESGTPSKVNTIELVQEIGQIDYVFSDKTGTLTRNEMKLVGCSIIGSVYGIGSHPATSEISSGDTTVSIFGNLVSLLASTEEELLEPRELAKDFVTMLAVCHTVLVDKSSGELKYNAEGPDEEALVIAAAELGVELIETNNSSHIVKLVHEGNKLVEYKVLAVNHFNSTRKRMSCVCECPDGKLVLFAKGADNVMYERLARITDEREARRHESMMEHLDAFANDGLRTLVFAKRELARDVFVEWKGRHDEALTLLGQAKADRLDELADELEVEFIAVGASAIEDRLQDGVPDTLVALREAGVKTWVLTGDKVETAVNIAFSAGLFTPDMQLVRLVSDNLQENIATLKQLQALVTPKNLETNSKQRKLGREAMARTKKKNLNSITKKTKRTIETNINKIEKWTSKVKNRMIRVRSKAKLRSPAELELMVDSDKGSEASDPPRNNWSLISQRSFSETTRALQSPEPVNVKEFSGSEKGLDGFVADNMALVVSGQCLSQLLSSQKGTPETEALLLSIAKLCHVVVGCRMSPKQKALIVKMVKKGVRIKGEVPITLAIGDGANDVAMIQEARVGVGISGHEGRQAVNSSDFAIAQFRFLRPLMLVHGRWNYLRIANTVLFVFYSQIVFTGCFFFYNCFNKFSGSALFYEFLLVIYSYPSCTAFVLLAITNKDISRETALAYPAMYISGRDNLHLGMKKIAVYVARSFLHTFLICAVQIIFLASNDVTLHVMGTATYFNCILVAIGRTVLETYTWTWINYAAILFCLSLFLVVEPLLYSVDPSIYTLNGGTALWALGDSMEANYIWKTAVLGTALCMVADMVFIYLRKELHPNLEEIVIEIDRGYSGDQEQRQAQLKNVNQIFRQIAQPLKIPKQAIAELFSSVQNVNIRPPAFRSGFAYAEPQDEEQRQSRSRMSRSFFFRKKSTKPTMNNSTSTDSPRTEKEDTQDVGKPPVAEDDDVAIDIKDNESEKKEG